MIIEVEPEGAAADGGGDGGGGGVEIGGNRRELV